MQAYQKIAYIKIAQDEYERTLVESRQGIPLNKAEFYENDRIISERLREGQHIYNIISSPDVSTSKSSAYRYLHAEYLSADPHDFPRMVMFKSIYKKKPEYVPKGVKIGRIYSDFLLNSKAAAEASSKIPDLKERLLKDTHRFGDIFPFILTDNGGEFSDVSSFETDSFGEWETLMFFCVPMQSAQKPFIEKNHTLFRDIIHKGSSFDDFMQDAVNLIFSHVNSIKRKKFNGKTPYDLFSFAYSDTLAALFSISHIREDKVVHSQKLQKTDDFFAN